MTSKWAKCWNMLYANDGQREGKWERMLDIADKVGNKFLRNVIVPIDGNYQKKKFPKCHIVKREFPPPTYLTQFSPLSLFSESFKSF